MQYPFPDMADLIRARFIHKILQEEGGRFLDRQTSQIQAKVKERSGRLLSGRRFQVYGSDGDFDGELVFTHPIYERFLDIRHLGGREKGTRRQIHNRPVMSAYNRIADRLMMEFTESTQAALRSEIDAIRWRFGQ